MKRRIACILALLTAFFACTSCGGQASGPDAAADYSPVEVVVLERVAMRQNDEALYISLLSEAAAASYAENDTGQPLNLGLMEFTLLRAYEAQGEHRRACMDVLKTYAEYQDIPEEDLAVVFVKYDAQYDGEQVFFSSGVSTRVYWLVREDGAWKISASGMGGMGAADDIYE